MLDFLMLTEDEKRGLKTPLCRTPVSDLLQFAAQFLPTTLYQSTLSYSSLFGAHSLPTTSTAASTIPHVDPVRAASSSYCSAESESADSKPESEVADMQDDLTVQPLVDAEPKLSDQTSDAVAISYPPMPATAQHVTEVQERILRGSSVNEDLRSPVQADTVDDSRASYSAVDPKTMVAELAASMPDVFPDVSELQECLSDVDHRQTERVVETPRSVTQRRSRIVARFGLAQRSECTPDSH